MARALVGQKGISGGPNTALSHFDLEHHSFISRRTVRRQYLIAVFSSSLSKPEVAILRSRQALKGEVFVADEQPTKYFSLTGVFECIIAGTGWIADFSVHHDGDCLRD